MNKTILFQTTLRKNIMSIIDVLQKEDFFGFCLIIEEQSFKTFKIVTNNFNSKTNTTNRYNSIGTKRQNYLKRFEDIITNQKWNHSNQEKILQCIVDNETTIAFN